MDTPSLLLSFTAVKRCQKIWSITNQNQNYKGMTWQLKLVPDMIARVILVTGVSLDKVIGYTGPTAPFHRCQKIWSITNAFLIAK